VTSANKGLVSVRREGLAVEALILLGWGHRENVLADVVQFLPDTASGRDANLPGRCGVTRRSRVRQGHRAGAAL
jgi:hypothetical protein